MPVFLQLLSTDHCALCDKALSMLFSMPDIAGLELRVVDVVTDNELLEKYGERVPVLQLYIEGEPLSDEVKAATSLSKRRLSDPKQVLELSWPFSPESVGDALRKL